MIVSFSDDEWDNFLLEANVLFKLSGRKYFGGMICGRLTNKGNIILCIYLKIHLDRFRECYRMSVSTFEYV